jgi:hypothetical protein
MPMHCVAICFLHCLEIDQFLVGIMFSLFPGDRPISFQENFDRTNVHIELWSGDGLAYSIFEWSSHKPVLIPFH